VTVTGTKDLSKSKVTEGGKNDLSKSEATKAGTSHSKTNGMNVTQSNSQNTQVPSDSGVLSVRPARVKFFSESILKSNKLDAYCEIILGSQVIRSKVHYDCRMNPRWSDMLSIKVNGEKYFL